MKESWDGQENWLAVFHRVEMDAIFPHAISRERCNITDAQTSVPKEKNHGSGPFAFIVSSPEFITSGDNLDYLFLCIGLLRFRLIVGDLICLGRIEKHPFPADAEAKEVSQDREFFRPRYRTDGSLFAKEVNGLNLDIIKL